MSLEDKLIEREFAFLPDTSEPEPQRLLLVDDDPTILALLVEFCSRLGHQYRTASNGSEALELLEQAPCTILVTDLIMPNMDGMELMKKVKEKWPDIDIMVMTGYVRDFTYTDVIRTGASDYLQKPFNLDEFEAKLNRIIRERALRSLLRRLSVRDPLTDLYNRRFFEQRLEEEAERAHRQNYPLYLLMVDLDNFKEINDTLGHVEGDKILKLLANVLTGSTRKNVDISFRYGGDEFVVLIPQATSQQVRQIAERIRQNYLKRESIGNTTLSIGISKFQRSSRPIREDLHDLVYHADEAMYAAKRTGGNKVIIYEEAKAPEESQ